ncbi:MAG: alanine/ornithine racemase family PLP-dependent enzyme [Bacteroidetes bacterium]|nr:alanine/ornithine racemase family PLP-dependent enzyme [Bacteroidota bacterium]
MAYIELKRKSLELNFKYLDERFKKYNKNWGVVAKILCGNEIYLKELVRLNPMEIHDSRLSNLEKLKKLAPEIQRVYIKPPPLNGIKRLVACADVSFNTHIKTIRLINEEAARQNVIHKIIIMIELGDLREGVMGEELIQFYQDVFELKNIEVIGLGANLNCLNGILPSKDKLIQLSLYCELINARFHSNIRWVSAGSSITLPLLAMKQIPKGCNHFRIGETLFFGNDIYHNKPVEKMKQDVFILATEVIEIREKPVVATGLQGTNLLGESPEIDLSQLGEESTRAIIDLGVLDVNPTDLTPVDPDIEIIGGSSDMIVLDVGSCKKPIRLGDEIRFTLNYTGVLTVMNSDYVEKKVV